MASIEEFKSIFNKGGARQNLFEVSWVSPGVGGGPEDLKKFYVKAANFPTSTITPIDVFYQGRTVKVAGTRPAYTDWTVTVINDEDFLIRAELEAWFEQMNIHDSPFRPEVGLTAYKVDSAFVQALGKDGTEGPRYEFVGLFPNAIGEVALDWSQDAIQEYTVTWSFDYFKPISG